MSDIVTAGILVIGDEILSGRTKDKNIGFIAEYLTNIGIDLKEVRVVADEEPEIIAALDALRGRYTYVFTTGGIGPTHDDITADSVAKAFGVGIDHHPEVVARFRERFQGAGELNEARLRMARIPDSAELIQSATILAPGFKIGNVIVMAGVPSIMQAIAVGIGSRQCKGRRHRRSLARNRQGASRHRHRLLSVSGRRQEAEHQSCRALARSGKTQCRDECGEGNAGWIERGPVAKRSSRQSEISVVDKNSFFWKIVDGRLPPPPCVKTLGIEFLQIDGERGTVEVKFEAKPEFLNPAGNVQGGFLAAMLDDTMGPALTATLDAGEFAPTVNLNVQFHRPAKVGPLKGVGRVVLRGKEVCQLSSELFQNDKIVATATATAVIRKM